MGIDASPARRRHPAAAQFITKGLREHAYAVDVVGDGEAALLRLSDTDSTSWCWT